MKAFSLRSSLWIVWLFQSVAALTSEAGGTSTEQRNIRGRGLVDDPWEEFNDEPSFGDGETVPPAMDSSDIDEVEEMDELEDELSEELLEEDGSMPPYKEEADMGADEQG